MASAGHAIGVVLVALLVAALVNANSLVASIEGQSYGTSRSVELSLAKPVRTISHWTGLDLPRQGIDDLVRSLTKKSSPHVALPAVPAVLPPARRAPSPAPTSTPSLGTTTTVPPPRVPTAAHPLKVWLAGDSLMGNISESFVEKAASTPLISATNDFQIGTGLARPDVYNWPAEVAKEMATVNPDVVIFIFGANDDQDMVSNGHRFVLQSPAWQQEYGRRVNEILGETATGTRQVIWLGIPAVRRPRLNQTKDLINQAVKAAVAAHPDVTYLDLGTLLDGPGNSFTTYLTNASGQSVAVRDSDGIHLTLAGAGLVTPVLLGDIKRFWQLPG
jgi:hypothetical protein